MHLGQWGILTIFRGWISLWGSLISRESKGVDGAFLEVKKSFCYFVWAGELGV